MHAAQRATLARKPRDILASPVLLVTDALEVHDHEQRQLRRVRRRRLGAVLASLAEDVLVAAPCSGGGRARGWARRGGGWDANRKK